jgi:hypothetical protein
MISLKDKSLLALSLCSLFAAGLGGGYFWGKRDAAVAAPIQAKTTPEAAAAVPGDWWKRALDRLASDLQLKQQQRQIVEPMLQRSADKVFVSRDRALFQMHLELLAFHEQLAAAPDLLDGSQRQRVVSMSQKLRAQIQQQFPQFLKDSEFPATAHAS